MLDRPQNKILFRIHKEIKTQDIEATTSKALKLAKDVTSEQIKAIPSTVSSIELEAVTLEQIKAIPSTVNSIILEESLDQSLLDALEKALPNVSITLKRKRQLPTNQSIKISSPNDDASSSTPISTNSSERSLPSSSPQRPEDSAMMKFLWQQIDNHQKQVSELRRQLYQSESEKKQLQLTKDESEKRNLTLQKQLQKSEDTRTQLQHKIKNLQSQNTRDATKLKNVEQRAEKNGRELSRFEIENKLLRAQLKESQNNLEQERIFKLELLKKIAEQQQKPTVAPAQTTRKRSFKQISKDGREKNTLVKNGIFSHPTTSTNPSNDKKKKLETSLDSASEGDTSIEYFDKLLSSPLNSSPPSSDSSPDVLDEYISTYKAGNLG